MRGPNSPGSTCSATSADARRPLRRAAAIRRIGRQRRRHAGGRGNVQRADFDAHAYNARIPGAVDFTIGRALAKGTIILYPSGPRVLADVQLANLRYGETVLSVARAKIDYANRTGTVQALANGSSGVPFTMGLSAQLQPKLWLVALQGKANGIAFRTAAPGADRAAEWRIQVAADADRVRQGHRADRRQLWQGRHAPGAARQARSVGRQRASARPQHRRRRDRQHRLMSSRTAQRCRTSTRA